MNPQQYAPTPENNIPFLTAGEASELYRVPRWIIIKAARYSNIQTKYCRRRWRRLYAVGPELAAAIENYIPIVQKKDDLTQHPVNQALNELLNAFRRPMR